ncbi:MAG: single-stranded DNA-binding protein [Gammaproteobacteria bacterium]|nr:single-stranded DNA-binding protein [Gammaproteobacteria bacterium]
MAGVNKVILVGNIGRDPEVRYTKSGQAVASFSLATSEKFTKKDGSKEETTEWHRIVIWGKLAEIVGEYCSKGKQVYLEGKNQTREWEDNEGNKKQTTEVVCHVMTMLGQAGGGSGSGQNSGKSGQFDEGAGAGSGGSDDFEGEDIPFN